MDDELLSGNFGQHQHKSGDQHVNTPSFTDLDEENRPQGNDNSFRDSLPSGSPQRYNPGTNRTNESPERSQSPNPKVKHVVSEKKPYTSPTKAARLAKQKQYEEECAKLTLEERAAKALARAHKIVGTPHHLHAQDIPKGANIFLQGEIRTQEYLTKAEAILEKSHKVGLTDEELEREEQSHKLSENVYPTKSPIKTEKLVDSTLKTSQSYTKKDRGGDGSSSPFKGKRDDKLPSFGGSTPTKGGMKASQDLKKSQELVRRLKETYGSASKNDEAIQKAGEILKKPPQSPLLARSGTKNLESGGGNRAVLERSNTKVRNFYEEVSPARFGESPNRQSKVQDAFNDALGQSQVMIKRSGTMLGGGSDQSPFKSMKTSYSQIFEGWGRAKSVFLENTNTFVIDPEKKDAINVKESYQSNLYLFGASLYACSPPGFFIPKDESKPIFVDERYDDGSTYKGEKLKDFRHGRGKLTYADGSSYDGEWDHGRRNGYGVFTMLTGRVLYDGEWRNDQYHGRGILYNNTNQDVDGFDCKDFETLENNWWKYEGEFENGKRNGLGSLVLRTTERFTGIFKLDKVHGIGTFHPKSGKIVSGTWDYNKLVSEV